MSYEADKQWLIMHCFNNVCVGFDYFHYFNIFVFQGRIRYGLLSLFYITILICIVLFSVLNKQIIYITALGYD